MVKKIILPSLLVFFLIGNAIEVTATTAEEWQDESIYFIMVDRFNNGNRANDYNVNPEDPRAYQGGDLAGVIEKLDYIKDMGFTTIWITPIMENSEGGYHGYWITDFKKVNKNFGTLEDAKKLVDEAHKRGIKVLFDFVANHTGYNSPWLDDPDKQDWFHPEKKMMGESPDQLENGWLAGLPDLNTENEEVRNYLFDAARFWIEETGIDGFRLDTVKHVPKDFWSEFSTYVKSIDEDFFLIGEVWNKDPRYIAAYETTGIDSFVDYPFYEEATNVFRQSNQSLDELFAVWNRNKAFYQNPKILGNFIDNHDNPRFASLVNKDDDSVTQWRLALTYMYTAPGIPIIYQGSEIAMKGGNDPDNRRMMEFDQSNGELQQYIKTLSQIRKDYPVLTEGDMEKVTATKEGLAVFKRINAEETIYVVINNSKDEQTVDFPDVEAGYVLTGLLQDQTVAKGESFSISGQAAAIFTVEKEEKQLGLLYGGIGAFVVVIIAVLLLMRRKKK
ncbi:alpha-amylase family glycosyl hydrolase [Aquibacillus salsiterrae]|uniref:Alpha-amylase n=1 Tax=Aquibacillus salsiterrae TaxID=2950439 RepID=A0A9X3WJK0_9BACI|nr:alpha-amylase family glycosyl hydrolase [Aquibacillus salsiterrae]MDC3418589.1 alpha-amylase family glycosyl hydrolase [Aquibacillus salsiterrae]